MNTKVQFRLRIHHGDQIAIGPGKVQLLEAIAQTGSITAAAKALSMSYRRAWLLVDEMNRTLREPVVQASAGGALGGGTTLTPTGEAVVRHYRAIEVKAQTAAARELAALKRLLAREPQAPKA